MKKIRMKDLPSYDRPYEKCQRLGPEVLSDAELLAVVIRTGSQECNSLQLAYQILSLGDSSEGIHGFLHLSLQQLMNIKGIGMVKATQVLCIGELSKRMWKREAVSAVTSYHDPRAIANYYMEDMRHKEQEELHLMLLNTKNTLIKDIMVSRGTVNASIITPRELLIEALRYRAVYMILVHNHPSGDPTPSKEDLFLTKRVKESGSLIGIQLIDHIVIGDNTYVSFREEGMF